MKKISYLVAVGLFFMCSLSAHAANMANGMRLYNQYCAACHGPRGEGVNPDAPKFRMGERLDQPDLVLMQSVKNGKKAMPPFFGVLQDPQILDILSYVRTLR